MCITPHTTVPHSLCTSPRRTVCLRNLTTALDTDAHIHVGKTVLAQQENGLIYLPSQCVGLDKVQGLACEVDTCTRCCTQPSCCTTAILNTHTVETQQALATLAMCNCYCIFLCVKRDGVNTQAAAITSAPTKMLCQPQVQLLFYMHMLIAVVYIPTHLATKGLHGLWRRERQKHVSTKCTSRQCAPPPPLLFTNAPPS